MGFNTLFAGLSALVAITISWRLSISLLRTLATAFVANLCFITLRILNHLYLRPVFSPLNGFPTPRQPAVHKRLFQGVRPEEVCKWMDEVPNDGLLRVFGLINDEFLIATRPGVIKEILATNAYNWVKPPKTIALLAMSIGHGLITVEGNIHKRQRRILQPAFGLKNIQALYPTFWAKTKKLLDSMAVERNANKILEIHDMMARTAIDMVGVAGFGLDFGGVEDSQAPMVRKYMSMFEAEPSVIPDLLCRILPSSIMINLPVDELKQIKMSRRALEEVIEAHVESQRAAMSSGNKLESKNILSIAMHSESLSNKELVNQAMTFIAAGSDTTGFTLTCAIFELCQNQGLQDRVRAEVRSKLPSPNSNLSTTSAEVDSLLWTTAVLNETLRFYPPVEVSARVSLVKTSIISGKEIPRNTMIDIPILAINRNKAFWGGSQYDTQSFRPERWLNEDMTKLDQTGGSLDPYAFMTFFRGVRACIGEKFARAEMAIVLAGIVGRYHLTLAGAGESQKASEKPNLNIIYGFTGKILGGLNVKIEEIEGW